MPPMIDPGFGTIAREYDRLRGDLATRSPTHPPPLLGPAADALADASRRRGSVFAGERARLAARARQAPADAELAARMFALASRIVPPVATTAVQKLESVFSELEEVRPRRARLFPVRDVPQLQARLRPHVAFMDVAVANAEQKAQGAGFVADLRDALSRRDYTVAVA
jgi:hypothetical protein